MKTPHKRQTETSKKILKRKTLENPSPSSVQQTLQKRKGKKSHDKKIMIEEKKMLKLH